MTIRETRFFVNSIEINTSQNTPGKYCTPMRGSPDTGNSNVSEGAKAEWMILDYKFEFKTSTYQGEMEGIRRAFAILTFRGKHHAS